MNTLSKILFFVFFLTVSMLLLGVNKSHSTDYSDLYAEKIESVFMVEIPELSNLGTAWQLESGIFVTAAHLFSKEKGKFNRITIAGNDFPSFKWDVQIIYMDEKRDMAILQMKEKVKEFEEAEQPKNLTIASYASLGIGDEYWGIGNRLGSFGHAYFGNIEKDGVLISNPYSNVFVLSGMVIPGDSGGPIFNSAGEVAGMAIAYNAPENIPTGSGIAITSDILNKVAIDIIRKKQKEVDTYLSPEEFTAGMNENGFVFGDTSHSKLLTALGVKEGDYHVTLSSEWSKLTKPNQVPMIDDFIELFAFSNTLIEGMTVDVSGFRADGSDYIQTIKITRDMLINPVDKQAENK